MGKKILILGAGTAGTIMANKLHKVLNFNEWEILVIDFEATHYYQPGFLFIPFGSYTRKQVEKPKARFIPKGVKFIIGEVDMVQPVENRVLLKDGSIYDYDFIIIASGVKLAPEETPGLKGNLWNKEIFEFYTLEGSLALHEKLNDWQGGHLVMAIVDMPFKCPVSPLEFVFLADEYFTRRGIRGKVNISFVTPLSGAFTKPIATKMLSDLLQKRDINTIPDFYIERIDNENRKLVSYDEREVPFDILTVVPLNKGADFVGKSGLGDDLNFIPVNKLTLQSEKHPNLFVLGDAAALPTSKAGAVAHFAADVVLENIIHVIEGRSPEAKFDGHANCYIETGFGKSALVDFNYDVEPLPGRYPLPFIGPFALLKSTRINHWGKLFFRWIYWNILIKGKSLPVTSHMSMTGKKKIIN
jgi:sulfide:quinone oxidoreductase